MPELPEVEVVKKSLKNKIINLSFRKVIINTNKLRYTINKNLIKTITNKKILTISRRSKYILINLDKNITILIHLGMTGKFYLVDKKNRKKKTSFYYKISTNDRKHNHVIFYLNNQTKLIYNDVRKFGFIKIISTNNLEKNKHLRVLGREPLSSDFNLKYFKKSIFNRKKNLKNILMDQKIVAGLGNIYVNEILHMSSLNPFKSIRKINDNDAKKIINYTKKILKKSIIEGGSSIKNFSNSDGKDGIFQQQFKVYGRNNKKCTKNKCAGIIKKRNISNRSTFYCIRCQK